MKIGQAFLLLMILVGSTAAMAADRGTRDEAKVMAEKAADHYRAVGTAALADFEKPEWRDRDLYVFAVKSDGTQIANGGNPALIGRNVIDMRDVDGKLTNREMLAVKETGWVEYKWRNPSTNAVEPKATYVVRVSDDTIVAVGAYNP